MHARLLPLATLFILAMLLGACASRAPGPTTLAYVQQQIDIASKECEEITDPVRREACSQHQLDSNEKILEVFKAIHTEASRSSAQRWLPQRAEIAFEVGHAFTLFERIKADYEDRAKHPDTEMFNMQVFMDSYTLRLLADFLYNDARWTEHYSASAQQEFYEGIQPRLNELRQLRASLYERLLLRTDPPAQ